MLKEKLMEDLKEYSSNGKSCNIANRKRQRN